MIRLTTLENRFEADLITNALEAEGINFVVRTFHDTAYDGLFETQKGYGLLLVEEEDRARAQTVVDDIRASVQED
ncbi:MAG: DUF2007 domain-containing protein [Thermodesulfobacteriota bacterium]